MGQDNYFLQTKRIGFRTWNVDNFELAKTLWGDFEVTKSFDGRGKFTDMRVRERLTHEISTQNEFGVQYWPIFNIETSDHIGACGLRPYENDIKIFEIGFHLCSNQWGKGYATEAALAVIEHAFKELKIDKLFAGYNPKNEASRHLLLKLGFEYTHDEYYEPTGLMHPSYLLVNTVHK
jgi:RimJ/RimL family protein N-acetyltransferase